MKQFFKIYQNLLPSVAATAFAIAIFGASAIAAPKDEKAKSVKVVQAEAEVADSTAADYFVSAPTSVFPTIDKITRLDMLDYFRAGSTKASTNLMGSECMITLDTPQQVSFKTSAVSEYTVCLLPSSYKNVPVIIMVIRTLKTPAEDSTLSFYDHKWRQISGIFTPPMLADWTLPEAKKNSKDIADAIPFMLAKAEYSPESQTVIFTGQLDDYIAQESLELAKVSTAKTLTYKWNGKKLVKAK
jgi:hypothetical protein